VRYWLHDGHLWSESWLPVPITPRSPLIVIEARRYLDWVEGATTWDRSR